MQAYYEIETQIPPDHRLNLQLPTSIPTGNVKITVIYETSEPSLSTRNKMVQFLAALPELEPEQGLSIDNIHKHIQQVRNDCDLPDISRVYLDSFNAESKLNNQHNNLQYV